MKYGIVIIIIVSIIVVIIPIVIIAIVVVALVPPVVVPYYSVLHTVFYRCKTSDASARIYDNS